MGVCFIQESGTRKTCFTCSRFGKMLNKAFTMVRRSLRLKQASFRSLIEPFIRGSKFRQVAVCCRSLEYIYPDLDGLGSQWLVELNDKHIAVASLRLAFPRLPDTFYKE